MLGLLILLLMGAAGLYLYLLGREYFLWPFFAYGKKSVRLVGAMLIFLAIDGMAIWLYSGEKTLADGFDYTKRKALASSAAYVIEKKLGLPQSVADGIMLVNVSSDDRRLIYTYDAETSDAQFITAVWKAIQNDVEKIACTRADYAMLLRNGLLIEHRIMRGGINVEPTLRLEPYMCMAQGLPL